MSAGPGFNETESPLTRLATRRGRDRAAFLSAGEAEAGERLRRDFTRAQMMPSIGQRWDFQPRAQRGPQGAKDLSDAALDARRRLEAAADSVGPELWGLLVDICCFLKGLETVERERLWPVRSAKVALKIGLAILARHYGTESGRAAEGRIRRWGTPDYRPTAGGRDKTSAEEASPRHR